MWVSMVERQNRQRKDKDGFAGLIPKVPSGALVGRKNGRRVGYNGLGGDIGRHGSHGPHSPRPKRSNAQRAERAAVGTRSDGY